MSYASIFNGLNSSLGTYFRLVSKPKFVPIIKVNPDLELNGSFDPVTDATPESGSYADAVTLSNGKPLPAAGKILYVNGADIIYYQEKELLNKFLDGDGNPVTSYATDNGEVGVYTGNYYTLRGRLQSLEVRATKRSSAGTYTFTAWVNGVVTYEGGQQIEPYIPEWATLQNGGLVGSTKGATTENLTTTAATSKTKYLIIGAIILFLITRK